MRRCGATRRHFLFYPAVKMYDKEKSKASGSRVRADKARRSGNAMTSAGFIGLIRSDARRMTSVHPKDLLRRVADGDKAAFSALYDATNGKLFSVCLTVLNNRAEAEEALQETYVKVWRRAGSFDAKRASAMSWLIAIARNASIDIARRRKGVAVDIEAAFELEDDAPGPEAAAQASGEARRLHECLAGLEGEQAQFIKYAYLGGLSYSQVAEANGKPLGTVKSLIRRGLQKLRACLETA